MEQLTPEFMEGFTVDAQEVDGEWHVFFQVEDWKYQSNPKNKSTETYTVRESETFHPNIAAATTWPASCTATLGRSSFRYA